MKKKTKGRKYRGKKYLSHAYEYEAAGEKLAESPDQSINKVRIIALMTVPIWLFLVYIMNGVWSLGYFLIHQLNMQVGFWSNFKKAAQGFLLKNYTLPFFVVIMTLLMAIGLATVIAYKFYFVKKKIAYGQKGDGRLNTLEETKEQFKAIPEAGEPFDGYGGALVSHYEDKFYIEDGQLNTIYAGTSRSGKGQTAVLQLIDNLSRAKKQSSMVINDPKEELYAASKQVLESRGYDVLAFNLVDPLAGMGDQLLALIVKYYKRGNIEYALQLVNALTYALYFDPEAGANKHFSETAQGAVSGIIIALLEVAEKTGEWEKCTMNNVAGMMTELASFKYMNADGVEVNALDEYFKNLPASSLAKKQYGSASFAGSREQGSIYSTVYRGLKPFVLPSLAKMTSRDSFDLKSVGFPKYIDMRVKDELVGQLLKVQFCRGDQIIGVSAIKVGYHGFIELNFDFELVSGDFFNVIDPNTGLFKQYQIQLTDRKVNYRTELTVTGGDLAIRSIEMHYSDRPTAIFMLVPDYDPSNHVLASIFINQLYTELAYQCSRTSGNECTRRVHMILDEFGNMPPISNLDQILTVTNGRNILWHLFVQSFNQIDKYGADAAKTIKDNCQTQIYIFSTNEDTIKEFSNKVGSKTIVSHNAAVNEVNLNNSISNTAEAQQILTVERISQFLEGETLVLRPLHRKDLAGRKVRPYPIFNTGKTEMPYAYQFLIKYGFDTKRDVNKLKFDIGNAEVDLEALKIDYSQFIKGDYAKRLYLQQQTNNAV